MDVVCLTHKQLAVSKTRARASLCLRRLCASAKLSKNKTETRRAFLFGYS